MIVRQPRLYYSGQDVSPHDVAQVSAQLVNLIVRHGAENRRIGLRLENSTFFVTAILTTIELEYSAVLLNPAFRPVELERAMSLAQVTLLLLPEETNVGDTLPTLRPRRLGAVETRWGGKLALWRVGEGAQPQPAADLGQEREFVVQFTSGVSGAPLAVCRTYAQADNELAAFISRARLTSDDVVLCAVPLFHSYGFFPGLMASLRVGAKFVVLPKFSPSELALLIDRHRPTILLGVPLMYEVLSLAHGDSTLDFSSFKYLVSAGGPLAPNVATGFSQRFGRRISQLYGSTETGVISFDDGQDKSLPSDSVGQPLAGRRVRIVDEQGDDVASGGDGEIILKSPATANTYLGRAEVAAEKIRDGWFFTSDIGHFDRQGRLHITGRKSAFINVGGLKVDPAEVEQAIQSSGEVIECAVIGVPRPQFGEAIHAYLVLKPGGSVDRIRAHCRGRISSFKMPREFCSVDRLPRSATGKVLRKDLLP